MILQESIFYLCNTINAKLIVIKFKLQKIFTRSFFKSLILIIRGMSATTKGKPQKVGIIDDFNGYYEFLNNDYLTWVEYEGILFPNVTTAFQAARSPSMQIRKKISELQSYEQFRTLVMTIKNPENWSETRYRVMQKLIRDKFKRNKEITNKLASTEDKRLYNCYKSAGENELYWGCVKQQQGEGQKQKSAEYRGANNLGKILETVRGDIIRQLDTQKWVLNQQLQQDPQLYPQVSLTVIKQHELIDKLLLENRNYFLFGSYPKIHFRLQHPSISKFHAAIYFSELQVILVDNNSTHGTFVIKPNTNQKTKLQPFQKYTLQNGDQIIFGMSSRVYQTNINFAKVQQVLKIKQQQMEKNVNQLKQAHTITAEMDRDEIKSKIGFKKYIGLYVQNINRNYSYNDIKQLFRKYGAIEKIRMIQNYYNSRFEGQVIVIYDKQVKVQNILSQIKSTEDKEIAKMQLKAVDKYDVDRILAKSKEDRQKRDDREKRRSRSRDKKRRSQSREKKEKHKKYDKYERDEQYRRER